MKLSKVSLLMLSIGMFVVIFASLGISYSRQVGEQQQLDEELSVAEMRLNNVQIKELRAQQDELQMRLDNSISQLNVAKDELRQPVDSISINDAFFDIARLSDVTVMSTSSSGIGDDSLGSLECAVLTLTASVAGETTDLIDFVIRLNEDYTTGVIRSAQLYLDSAADNGLSDNMTVSDNATSTATVRLVVYGYEGN